MRSKISIHLIAFLGLLGTYAIAYGLDRWLAFLRTPAAQADLPPPAIVQSATRSLASLVLALCVFSLYQWVMPRLGRWAIWLTIVIGLLFALFPIFYWAAAGSLSVVLTSFLANWGYVSSVGGWSAVAGIFTLFQSRKTLRSDQNA